MPQQMQFIIPFGEPANKPDEHIYAHKIEGGRFEEIVL
jgi:hypothetical protein